jgi:hypothetical protein
MKKNNLSGLASALFLLGCSLSHNPSPSVRSYDLTIVNNYNYQCNATIRRQEKPGFPGKCTVVYRDFGPIAAKSSKKQQMLYYAGCSTTLTIIIYRSDTLMTAPTQKTKTVPDDGQSKTVTFP